MNFSTMISQVQGINQPVKAVPTYEQKTVYFHYPTMQFVNSLLDLTPAVPVYYDGYGKLHIIAKWNDEPADEKEIPIKINLYISDPYPGLEDYIYDEDLMIYVKKTIDVPASKFNFSVQPFPPMQGFPTTDIVIFNMFIERTAGLYEVY
jgi:hypothetical protein